MFSKCVEFITSGTGRCQQNELRWGLRTLKYAKAFTPRTSNYCLSTRRFPKRGRCSGAIYSQYNIENLLSLSREGDMTSSLKGIVDNLSMTYDGNMLASVSDSAPAPSVTGSADFRDGASEAVEYTYDRNGNMTSDLNRKVSLISYNRQNRPARMRHAGGTETFTYLPDGTKRGRTVLGKDRSLSRTEYRGNLVCADDTLKYILFDGGLIAMDGSSPEYLFFLRDHLGSVRVVARPDGKAVQVNHYYPYGMAFAGGGMSGNAGAHPVEGGVSVAGGSLEIGGETGGMELARPGASQPYRFLGNELYTSNSLGLYDFSARMYDPALGRFLSVDPMAEGYRHLSPYAYCAGNPVVYVDKDGQVIGRVVVGAVVGAAINGGIALLSGESGRDVLGAVARGAVDGGIAGLTFGMSMGTTLAGKIAVSAAVGAATSTASSTVGQLVESGGVDAREVATDAAVGAVTGGVMQKASSKLWNAREKTINNLSPSKYVETVEKEVKKERILSGRGTSGTAARAEIHKETVARTNNLYQTDVFVADFSYNAANNVANNAVNNTVQMGTTSLMQKLTGSKE